MQGPTGQTQTVIADIAACNLYKFFRPYLAQNQAERVLYQLCKKFLSFRFSSSSLRSPGRMQLHFQVTLHRAIRMINVSGPTFLGNHGSHPTAVTGYTTETNSTNSRAPSGQRIIHIYWGLPPTHIRFTVKYICTSYSGTNAVVHHYVPLRQWHREFGSYLP